MGANSMKSKTYRLDRFIREYTSYSLSDTRLLIAQGRITVDGEPAHSIQQAVTEFTQVQMDGASLQNNKPIYIMLNKPKGVVSATKDDKHTTVIDIIDHPQKQALHIVGRLDFNTTGLILLTNDGAWSRKISLPESKLEKTYNVRLKLPLSQAYIEAFASGMYFSFEGITTAPATLQIRSEYDAELKITEGKYHQIKRMFGQFQNEVLDLHRVSIGRIKLGESLQSGEYRSLTPDEILLGI